ncbi:hypothetical protein [Streptomyces alfalfae]|uniref:hypothetical protein n=1 Tax=Streptomyces alfalfae TaxID=1642299 RepID=UPI001BA70BBC|nr:hypothetical protein [Streptomyces alfalfae]QUI35544.1 hypothetical protein H9W91_35530 [Streptomyces alfalfae]
MRRALPALCLLTLAAGAVVVSARPGVPVGPAEPRAASGPALGATGDLPPVGCGKFAAEFARSLDAETVRRADAMMHGTGLLTSHAVPEECADDITRAKKRPRAGALAECARTAEKWVKEPGAHVFGAHDRLKAPGDDRSGEPDARARIKECLPLAQRATD